MSSQHIDKINKALSGYYRKKNTTYFTNDDNVGKFKKFCEDNGLNDDHIHEELQSGAQDCILVDFDEHFPLTPPIHDTVKKNETIFNILKYCYENTKSPPPYLYADLLQVNFSLANDEKEVTQTENIYKKQCEGLVRGDQKQLNFFRILTVGRLNDIPLLNLLCDSFTRDRILCCLQQDKSLDIATWIRLSPTIKKLKFSCAENKNYINYKDFENGIKSAMTLYFTRYNSKISFTCFNSKINATVEQFAQPALEMIDFINEFVSIGNQQNKNILPPFQFELMFIPPPAINITDDEDEKKDAIKKNEPEIIGNIEKRLAECVFVVDDLQFPEKQNEKFDYKQLLRQFKKKMRQKYSSDHKENADDFSIVHQRRYCVAIDFRNKQQKIYMFEPPISNKIGIDVVDERAMQLSYDCILPKGHTNLKTITASNSESQVFILSFQVFAANKIKCYWYQRNQISRFFPQDIVNLWPKYFAQKSKDVKEMKNIANKIKKKELIDDRFKLFYEPIDKCDIQNNL